MLVAIGGVDLLFAHDSIPAIFGVTQQADIVVAANASALLGLRAQFFLVIPEGAIASGVFWTGWGTCQAGLSLILAFSGVKPIPH